MALAHNPKIPTQGLEISIDNTNVKSAVNNIYYNLVEPTDDNSFNQKDWMTGLTAFSVSLVIEVIGSNTTYAYHPINRWGNSSTSTASFVLYHFQQHTAPTINDGATNVFTWYANVNGVGWTSISSGTGRLNTYPQTYWMGFQYWVDSGNFYGQRWLNGQKGALRTGALNGGTGALGSGSGGTSIQSTPDNNYGNIHWVKQASLYSRTMSDDEMMRHWQIAKVKHGL